MRLLDLRHAHRNERNPPMSKLTLIGFMLPLLLLFASPDANSKNSTARKQTTAESGTLQKMIVENGVVTIDLDLDRLIADGSLAARMVRSEEHTSELQ